MPITASDHETLGSLCLLREPKTLDDVERRLLQALASHAALSLENFRRFSQLERSKRQWVEDIDAISDYIVVHDRVLAHRPHQSLFGLSSWACPRSLWSAKP